MKKPIILLLIVLLTFILVRCSSNSEEQNNPINGLKELLDVGEYEGYKPKSDSINFPHDLHAGMEKIDCKYCHTKPEKYDEGKCLSCHDGNAN